MNFKEVKITFRTITPLWTGDAWQENKEVRPSSLIGSLRFWFEVICYFAGICDRKDFKNGRFEKEVDRKKLGDFIKENGNDLNQMLGHLYKDQQIPLPSIIFGSTNWKSLIRIERIEESEDYCYGNKLNFPQPPRICVSKTTYEIKEGNGCPARSNNDWSVFYLAQPYFYGKFKVVFKIAEEILETIFCPLITFMDKYGYWGGKWNIGYGRLKIEKVEIDKSEVSNWCKDEFNLEFFKNGKLKSLNYTDLIKLANNYDELLQEDRRIKILENQVSNKNLENVIKDLIKEKARQRRKIANTKDRHLKFGTTKPPPKDEDLPQGSKILPFINENNGKYNGGFLSVVDLIDLYEEGKNG